MRQWRDGGLIPLLDDRLLLRVVPEGLVRVRQDGLELHVPVPLGPWGLEATLERWYRLQAQRYLGQRLREWAGQMEVSVLKVTIRGQSTRWGSCSSRGSINLNWRLMCIPARLVDYVLVHELCHRKEMNHSPAFWALVAGVLPDYSRLRQDLKKYRVH